MATRLKDPTSARRRKAEGGRRKAEGGDLGLEVARAMGIAQTSDLSVNDPTIVKITVQTCITSLRDEDGLAKTRALAIAVTKLEEAVMWIDEHSRLS